MLRFGAVLIVLVVIASQALAIFPMPGSHMKSRGMWNASGGQLSTPGTVAIGVNNLTLDNRDGELNEDLNRTYLLTLGIAPAANNQINSVNVDIIGGTTSATKASASVIGLYPRVQLRSAANPFGMFATLDAGAVISNDATNTTYTFAAGWYDHTKWTSPIGAATTWTVAAPIPVYTSLYALPFFAPAGTCSNNSAASCTTDGNCPSGGTCTGVTGTITTNGGRVAGLFSQPTISSGATVSEYDTVIAGDPANATVGGGTANGTVTKLIGYNTDNLTAGTTDISYQSQQLAVASVATSIWNYNPNGGSSYTTSPAGGTTALTIFNASGAWTWGGSSSPNYSYTTVSDSSVLTLTATAAVVAPAMTMIQAGQKLTSSVTNGFRLAVMQLFNSNVVMEETANAGTVNTWSTLSDNTTVQSITNASAALTVTNFNTVASSPVVSATVASAAVTITARRALYVKDITFTATGNVTVGANVGMDIADMVVGTSGNRTVTNVYGIRSALVSATGKFFLADTGGAASYLSGNLRVGDASSTATAATNPIEIASGKLIVNSSGIISTYNNTTKDASHNGVPLVGWHDSATGKTANVSATNLIASATAGRYRMCCNINVTTAAGTSSTIPDCNLICTDPTDSAVKTMAVSNGSLFPAVTNPGTGVGTSGCGICNAKTATAIQYSTTNYASVSAGMTYDYYITLEAL